MEEKIAGQYEVLGYFKTGRRKETDEGIERKIRI